MRGSAIGVGQLTQGRIRGRGERFGYEGLSCCGQFPQACEVGSTLSTPRNVINDLTAVQADRASFIEGGAQQVAPVTLEECREPGEQLLLRHSG